MSSTELWQSSPLSFCSAILTFFWHLVGRGILGEWGRGASEGVMTPHHAFLEMSNEGPTQMIDYVQPHPVLFHIYYSQFPASSYVSALLSQPQRNLHIHVFMEDIDLDFNVS
jgi:hypothetical protein